MSNIHVNVLKVDDYAVMPKYAHEGDAGADICACEDVSLCSGEYKMIRTGIRLELPTFVEAQVRSRSGLAAKHGVAVLNSPGTIDSGYRGEIGVVLINHGKERFEVKAGDRIAQLVFKRVPEIEFIELGFGGLSETERGECGFGSTGID